MQSVREKHQRQSHTLKLPSIIEWFGIIFVWCLIIVNNLNRISNTIGIVILAKIDVLDLN